MVLLIGNYPADEQPSMQRFATMMQQGLAAAGVSAELIQPRPYLGRTKTAGRFIAKWLGYIDKFLLFPLQLRRRLSGNVSLVHICDHSNAMYGAQVRAQPVVVTCHDLLAVRGAMGEETDYVPSPAGKYLQRWILSSLRKAKAIACVSRATLRDAERLIEQRDGRPQLRLIHNGLNYPYKKLPDNVVRARLTRCNQLDLSRPFLLHVGSNLRMKNREGVLRIFSLTKESWDGQLVFAGEKLTPELCSLGEHLDVMNRVVEIVRPAGELLEALYNRAVALLYPSRFEGFGWPIIEAQACGCPVICSDREPMSEVGGAAALTHPLDDEAAFARSVLALTNPSERERWSAKSLDNAKRFETETMIASYIKLYRDLGATV